MPAATIIRSDHADYWRWHAAAARGQATILGYSYAPDGTRMAAATTWVQRMKTNPLKPGERIAITFGKKFFTDTLKEYNDLVSRCWFREAIQNAVDAKARRIDITTKELSDGRFEAVVVDDGMGMSEDILYNKFLVPAASGKEGDIDATGGFGDAKRLLFWPWCQYTVLTNGSDGPLGVQGEGVDVIAIEGVQAQGRGTQISVIMPKEQHVDPNDAIWFIQRCYLPRVKFTVNGQPIEAKLDVGKEIDAGNMDDDLHLYHSPRSTLNAFIVRINGILMFEVPADDGIVKGALIAELKKPSIEVLAKNRNELKTRPWRASGLVQQMAQDRMSRLKPKKTKQERTWYKGNERIAADIRNTMGKLYDVLHDHFRGSMNKKIADSMAQELELMVQGMPRAEANGVFMPTPGMAKIITQGLGETLQVEAAAQQLAWAADFYIVNEDDEYKVPKWIRPEGMEVRPKKLARLWLEFCRLILIRLGYKEQFGIGWIISKSDSEKSGYTKAAYCRDNGMHWLLLNPFIGGNVKEEKIYSLRDPYHLNALFAMAVHECTHLVNKISYHNEEFASYFTENLAQTLPSAKLMLAIRDAVAARKEDDPTPVKKAKGMGELCGEILSMATNMDTNADLRAEAYSVLSATDGWQKLQISVEKWQQSIGLDNPAYEFRNVLRYIVQVFKDQGMSKYTAVMKILDTVPKEICPETLAFPEFRMCVAYWVWREYA